MDNYILGLSCYYHDSAAALLIDGKIVKSGSKNLALKLEEKGYGWLEE